MFAVTDPTTTTNSFETRYGYRLASLRPYLRLTAILCVNQHIYENLFVRQRLSRQ